MPRAVARRSAEKMSEIMEWDGDYPLPRPRPRRFGSQKLNKASGEAAERGHATPDREAYRECSRRPDPQARNGNAEKGVEEGKSNAPHEPHLRI